MSLTPIFPPFKSAYRFDLIELDQSVSVSLRSIYSVDINPNGSYLYAAHEDADQVEQYDISTWDITGATASTAFTLSLQGVSPTLGRGLQFSPNGLTVWVGTSPSGGQDYIEEHTLSSAYGGTATYVTRVAFPATGAADGFAVIDDGTKVVASVAGVFYDATLGTAWDLTSIGSWSLAKLDLSATYTGTHGFTFGKTTAQLIICELPTTGSGRGLHEYTLSTPGDVSTATFTRTYEPTDDGLSTNITDIVFGDAGRSLFGLGEDEMHQWFTVG